MCHIAMQASGEDKQHINITCHLATVALGKIKNISHITKEASGKTKHGKPYGLGGVRRDKCTKQHKPYSHEGVRRKDDKTT